MKFIAYNMSTDSFVDCIEVESEANLPGYLWDFNLVQREEDIMGWKFWEVTDNPITIEVVSSYTINRA